MKLILLLIVATFIANLQSASSFALLKGTSITRGVSLHMVTGRSPNEKGQSQRVMFKELKKEFNKAAEDPAFFETGFGPPEIDLFCKSNGDGTQIGDCPFTQFVQLTMLAKGLRYTVKPTLSNNKPQWLTEKHDGKMPALVHKGKSMTDSLAIAQYLEEQFPTPKLNRAGIFSYEEVLEKTAGFFPALSAYIKNKDEAKDDEFLTAVNSQLDNLDEIIRSSPGKYICGIEMTLADLYLAPQMYHAMITMDIFKGQTVYNMEAETVRPALENWFGRMLSMPEFNDKRAYYNVDQVVYGWKKARA